MRSRCRCIRTSFLALASARDFPLAAVADAFTRSLNSLAGLKWGKCFAGTETFPPVLGLRTVLGGRCCAQKLPKPMILHVHRPTGSSRPIVLKNSKSRGQQISARCGSNRKCDPDSACEAIERACVAISVRLGDPPA